MKVKAKYEKGKSLSLQSPQGVKSTDRTRRASRTTRVLQNRSNFSNLVEFSRIKWCLKCFFIILKVESFYIFRSGYTAVLFIYKFEQMFRHQRY